MLTRTIVCDIVIVVIGGNKMVEILKSKGIICFFIFIIAIGMLSSNSLDSMSSDNTINNVIVMNETIK